MTHPSNPDFFVDVRVMGSVVRIVCPDAPALAAVREAWHLCALDGGVEHVHGHVVLEPASAEDTTARTRSLSRLTQRVTKEAIRLRAGRSLLLHAGGLSHPDTGASVVFVARGGTGKTTLTRTLGPHYCYLSDETIAVDRDGRIEPYLKPLSLVRAGGRGKDEVAPGALGLRGPSTSPWLASLIALRRAGSHEGAPQVTQVGLLDAIAMLSPETSSLAALHDPLRTFAELIEAAGGLKLVTYREAPQLGGLVHALLERGR